jgi:hypothetical protein
MSRTADIDRLSDLRAAGLCRDCRIPATKSRTRCFDCARIHAIKQAARTDAKRAKESRA